MIVSHKYRFIFLHSRKTAGSSVSVSLLRYLEPDDLHLNAPAHGILMECLRDGRVPGPMRHETVVRALADAHGRSFADRALRSPQSLTRDERMAVVQTYNSLQTPYPEVGWQHVSAAAAREHLGPEVWDSYFKFSFERNPWDRMASLYWWRMRKLDVPSVSFPDFIAAMASDDEERIRKHKAFLHTNWPIYTIDDEVAVDHLGRFEHLADELQAVADKVGLPWDGWLPRSKGSIRRTPDVADLYDRDTVHVVGEIFHREVALLGYEPPDVSETDRERKRLEVEVKSLTQALAEERRRRERLMARRSVRLALKAASLGSKLTKRRRP